MALGHFSRRAEAARHTAEEVCRRTLPVTYLPHDSPPHHTPLSFLLHYPLPLSPLFLQVPNKNVAFHHTIYARQVEDEELELDDGGGVFELGPDGGVRTHRVIDSSVASAIAASPAAVAFFEACRP